MNSDSGRELRYIHVGLGGWGEYWARVVMPHARDNQGAVPVAVVDADPSRLGIAAEYLGMDPNRCFTSVDDALRAVDCDFVSVVVTPAHHESVIDAAVAAGKHILCEKPIADTLDGCIRITNKVAAADLKMAVTMSHRFDQDKQTLQAAVRSGAYGQLNYLAYRFTSNSRRFGSWGEFRHQMIHPLLIEGTVHHFDIMRAITGSDARTVYANTWNPPWGEFQGDSTALIVVEMLNGTRVLYEGAKANATTLNGWTQDYIRAECEDVTLVLDRRRFEAVRSGADGLLTTTQLPLSTTRDHWQNQAIMGDFCAWLRGGAEPETNYLDNLQCCALLFAAVESAETGKPVDVQEFLEAAESRISASLPL